MIRPMGLRYFCVRKSKRYSFIPKIDTMKTRFLFTAVIIITLILLPQDTEAQGRSSRGHKGSVEGKMDKRVGTNHHRSDRYRTQPIGRRPHYRYPRHHRYVRTLPIGHTRLYFGGLHYYFHAGIYYTLHGGSYIVVLPPAGFRITVLPVGHVRVIVGPRVYFYHSGVYYVEVNKGNEQENYQVAQPPLGGIINTLPEEAEEVEVDGKILYDDNGILYKKIYLKEDKIGYEIVYVSKETKA